MYEFNIHLNPINSNNNRYKRIRRLYITRNNNIEFKSYYTSFIYV